MPILDMPDGSYVSYRGKQVLDEATKQKLVKLVELAQKQAERESRTTHYHLGCGGVLVDGYCTLCEMDEDEARAALNGADPRAVANPDSADDDAAYLL